MRVGAAVTPFWALDDQFPSFPQFLPQNLHFGGRPMYFQWGAFRAVANVLIDRIRRLVAQTTQFGEFFHAYRDKMLYTLEIPQLAHNAFSMGKAFITCLNTHSHNFQTAMPIDLQLCRLVNGGKTIQNTK